jgi:hypothetical protein
MAKRFIRVYLAFAIFLWKDILLLIHFLTKTKYMDSENSRSSSRFAACLERGITMVCARKLVSVRPPVPGLAELSAKA